MNGVVSAHRAKAEQPINTDMPIGKRTFYKPTSKNARPSFAEDTAEATDAAIDEADENDQYLREMGY